MDLIDRQALLRKLFPYEVVDKRNCAINAYAVEKAILEAPAKEFNTDAIEYLEKVLDNWNTWRSHHEPLCKAIETLLEEVKDDQIHIPHNINNS
jgi:hypothetical protein